MDKSQIVQTAQKCQSAGTRMATLYTFIEHLQMRKKTYQIKS